MATKVKISKVAHLENALHNTIPLSDYVAGQDNGNISLPVDYWLEGFMVEPPSVGKSLIVARTSRNGVDVGGYFTTSEVTEITEDGFKTLNSLYKLEYI